MRIIPVMLELLLAIVRGLRLVAAHPSPGAASSAETVRQYVRAGRTASRSRMTMTNRQGGGQLGWLRLLLAVGAVALVGLFGTVSSSASATSVAETRAGASTLAMVRVVGVAEHVAEGQRSGNPSSQARATGGSRVAAKSADEFVDLASAQRRTHILTGDATGGGHLWPGLPGKTPFPKSWSGDRIMHEICDIATDPAAWANVQNQGQRAVLYGTRGGVEIKVVVNRGTGDIITGHPINLPRNPG